MHVLSPISLKTFLRAKMKILKFCHIYVKAMEVLKNECSKLQDEDTVHLQKKYFSRRILADRN